MNSMYDFYDKMDLKYPELAIAMDDIDRSNPGVIRFVIPVLTPLMNNNSPMSDVIRQTKSNLMNDTSIKLEVDTIKVTNTISIPVPQEVCNVYNLDDSNRIIKSGSKWIVVFVGGDITKPRIISRY